MAIVAVSKNKRTQPLFRISPSLRPQIIVVFGGEFEVNDMIFEAQISEDVPAFEADDTDLGFALLDDEVTFEIDDSDVDTETCE